MQSVMPACTECMKPLTSVLACLLADVADSIMYAQMFFKVFNGYRPPLPDSMPAGMQKLMEACWSHNPAERPSVRFIVRALQRLIIEVGHLPLGLRWAPAVRLCMQAGTDAWLRMHSLAGLLSAQP